jgi:hypothetical protein
MAKEVKKEWSEADMKKHKMMAGWKMVILGLLVIAAVYFKLNLGYSIGGLIILVGLMKLLEKGCCHGK